MKIIIICNPTACYDFCEENICKLRPVNAEEVGDFRWQRGENQGKKNYDSSFKVQQSAESRLFHHNKN